VIIFIFKIMNNQMGDIYLVLLPRELPAAKWSMGNFFGFGYSLVLRLDLGSFPLGRSAH